MNSSSPPVVSEEEAGSEPDLALTDLGNVARFVRQHGTVVRYCPPMGTWFVWNGERWRRDDTGEIERLAKDTVRAIYTEVALESDPEQRQRLAKWALRSESGPRIREIQRLAQTEDALVIRPADLDGDPFLLNDRNGTIDLRTGELRPHRATDLITRQAPVHYDPAAQLTTWNVFLAHTTGGDLELQRFLQQAAGYSLTGAATEERFFMPYGPTRTGKSTFLDALGAALGDYAATADMTTWLARRDAGGPRSDLARLPGIRMVTSIEVGRNRRLDDALMKSITGGDAITCRDLYRSEFTYTPQFTLWLAVNHPPKLPADDDAVWRRVLRVPFLHQVSESDMDPTVKARLRDPEVGGAAILAWAVRGCLDWHENGLVIPDVIRAETAAYRAENDPFAEFFEDRCVFGPDLWTATGELYAAYEKYIHPQQPESKPTLVAHLKARGLQRHKETTGEKRRGYLGVGLRGPQDPAPSIELS